MLIVIPNLLSRSEALALAAQVRAGPWGDGNATSGTGAALAKRNRQLDGASETARAARTLIGQALARNALFISAALPRTIVPPLFNLYGVGEGFGHHVDNAIRADPETGKMIRTDLSATLFLADPDDYDGGALTIDGPFGTVSYKLPMGHMLLYPATSLHRVTEVTRGERLASFFWIESLIADHDLREQLFTMDRAIQALGQDHGLDDPRILKLTAAYHNLVRRFAGPGGAA